MAALGASDQSFVLWAREQSMPSLENVELTIAPSGLRGLVAKRELPAKSPIVSWPAALALEVTTDMRAPEGVSRTAWAANPEWYVRLAILLLLERDAGDGSPLAPWIRALPRSFDQLPYYWTDAELDALQYPALGAAVRRQREDYQRFHTRLRLSEAGDWDMPSFEWALHAVRSRAFSGAYEGSSFKEKARLLALASVLTIATPLVGAASVEQALTGAAAVAIALIARDVALPRVLELRRYVVCPFIDMLNHRGDSLSDVAYQVFTNEFVMSRTEPVEAGAEVFINYGARSNDQLLQFHGFVEEGCVTETYVMPRAIEHIDAATGVPDSALDELGRAGLLSSLQAGARFDAAGRPDEPTLEAMGALHSALGGKAPSPDGGAKSGATQLLLTAALRELEILDTPDDALSGRADGGDVRAQLAVAYVREKRRVLAQAARYLEEQLRGASRRP